MSLSVEMPWIVLSKDSGTTMFVNFQMVDVEVNTHSAVNEQPFILSKYFKV
jgi:hypothetical protein